MPLRRRLAASGALRDAVHDAGCAFSTGLCAARDRDRGADQGGAKFIHDKYMGELFVGTILEETRAGLVEIVAR